MPVAAVKSSMRGWMSSSLRPEYRVRGPGPPPPEQAPAARTRARTMVADRFIGSTSERYFRYGGSANYCPGLARATRGRVYPGRWPVASPSMTDAAQPHPGSRRPTGVLLIQLGTPDSAETGDVRSYLREFLSDERVLDMAALDAVRPSQRCDPSLPAEAICRCLQDSSGQTRAPRSPSIRRH